MPWCKFVCGPEIADSLGGWEQKSPTTVAGPQSCVHACRRSTTLLPLSGAHCETDKCAAIGRLWTWSNRMIFPSIGIVTTGTVAIAKIDVLRIHAAELYAAPAIGEFFDCKCWRNQAESFFFGQWADVERAHAMLATIRSAMEREFADFFETGAGGENPKALAAAFSKGMGHRISQRLRRLKAGRPANRPGEW